MNSRMISEDIFKEMTKDISLISDITGMSKGDIERFISTPQIDSDKFSDKLKAISAELKLRYINDMHNGFKSGYSEIDYTNTIDSLDVMHTIKTALHFVVNVDKLKRSDVVMDDEVDVISKLNDFEDILIDFRDSAGYASTFRISKCRYKLEIGDKLYTTFNCSFTVRNNNVNPPFNTMEFKLIPEKYPRIYISKNETCNKCNKCSTKTYKLVEDGLRNDIELCMCRESVRINHICDVDRQTKLSSAVVKTNEIFGFSLTMDFLCYYAVHCLKVYLSRNKIKVNRLDDTGVRMGIKQHEKKDVHEGNDSVHIVSISEYSSYERREKKEWQGGHHNSPVTHYRRGCIRHYKNGKVVEVRPTIVNENNAVKSSGIAYEVKE